MVKMANPDFALVLSLFRFPCICAPSSALTPSEDPNQPPAPYHPSKLRRLAQERCEKLTKCGMQRHSIMSSRKRRRVVAYRMLSRYIIAKLCSIPRSCILRACSDYPPTPLVDEAVGAEANTLTTDSCSRRTGSQDSKTPSAGVPRQHSEVRSDIVCT